MTDQIIAEPLGHTLALTILLTGDEVDGIIFALEYASDSTFNSRSMRFWDVRPRETRRQLLERLRAHVSPVEMTVAQILEREA